MDSKKIEEKMARFHNGVRYSITINPDDNFQFHVGMNRWAYVRQEVMNLMSEFAPQIEELELYPDISYPPALRGGVYPRIHFHGWITWKDIINVLTRWEHRSHFSVEIDTIQDHKLWEVYCKKLIKLHPGKEMFRISLQNLIDETKPYQSDKRNILEFCNQGDSSDVSDESD